MNVRTSAGRTISMLNEDPRPKSSYVETLEQQKRFATAPARPSYGRATRVISQPFTGYANDRGFFAQITPDLARAESYDSQRSNGAHSPCTPSTMYADYGINGTAYSLEAQAASYDDYPDPSLPRRPRKQAAPSDYVNSRPMIMCDDDGDDDDVEMADSPGLDSPALPTERPGKRYPCRYRETHGCEKTFTTSGHASRHSKIHTAEKSVQCTFHSCTKKFTRGDNMKQHLETHYKEKSRNSVANGMSSVAASSISTRPSLSALKRHSSSAARVVSGSSRRHSTMAGQTTLPLPGSGSVVMWDRHGNELPPTRMSTTSATTNAGGRPPTGGRVMSGLDTLAMVVTSRLDRV